MSFVRCTIQATITQKTKEQVWFCKQSWQWGILIVFVLSRGIIFAKKYCHTWSSVQCSEEEANLRLLWLSTFYTKYSKNSEGLFWGKCNSFGFSLKMCSDHNHVHSLWGASFCSCEWTIEVPCLLSFFSHLIFLEKSSDKLIVWCLDCLKLQPKSAFF